MPAKSEKQRRYLNWKFGHEWVKKHHFDNKGKLPMTVHDETTMCFRHWLESATKLSGYGSLCPACGGEAVATCKCPRNDTWCEQGHQWHRCPVHNKTVMGNSHGLGVGINGCTCG